MSTRSETLAVASLASRFSVGGGLTQLEFDVTPEHGQTFTTPGQFALVLSQGEEGYFALACAVGDPRWAFVVRRGGGVADALVDLPLGETAQMTVALGHGFPCDAARGALVRVAVMGGGIGAVRPVVARRIEEGDASRTEVFIGLRARGDVPLASEIDAWRAAGARVTICLSRERLEHLRESTHEHVVDGFAHGYVQDVMISDGIARGISGGRIFCVGANSMVDAVRLAAPSLGVTASDVVTNY